MEWLYCSVGLAVALAAASVRAYARLVWCVLVVGSRADDAAGRG